jgi:long-chain-fatty-acid--CoA ligase ACSBG
MSNGQPSDNLESECARFFKENLDVELKTASEAVKHPKVTEYVKQCVNRANDKLVSNAAKIKEFRLLPVDFSMPGGELTPTLKLKRNVTAEKYKDIITEIYSKPKL